VASSCPIASCHFPAAIGKIMATSILFLRRSAFCLHLLKVKEKGEIMYMKKYLSGSSPNRDLSTNITPSKSLSRKTVLLKLSPFH
jgi:hypothetical protein